MYGVCPLSGVREDPFHTCKPPKPLRCLRYEDIPLRPVTVHQGPTVLHVLVCIVPDYVPSRTLDLSSPETNCPITSRNMTTTLTSPSDTRPNACVWVCVCMCGTVCPLWVVPSSVRPVGGLTGGVWVVLRERCDDGE